MKKVIIESMLLEAKTSKDDFMAESWILTAKTLGNCFEVENVGYQMQIKKKNASSAAESLQQMYVDYSTETKFWDEVWKIIDAVKNDQSDEMGQFYKSVFQKLLPAMQQTLLLEMAEKQKDKMDQCRYLLLLFKLFPETVAQFGLQLIDLLGDFSDEKSQENVYTQILVNEIIPMLLKCKDLSIPETKCWQLFKQSLNFHLIKAWPNNRKSLQSPNLKSPKLSHVEISDKVDPWHHILQTFLLTAEKCDWRLAKKFKNLRLETLQEILDQISTDAGESSEKISIAILIFTYLAYQKHVVDDFKESSNLLILIPEDQEEDEKCPKIKKIRIEQQQFDQNIKWSSTNNFVDKNDRGRKIARFFRLALKCVSILRSKFLDQSSSSPPIFPTNHQIWFSDFLDDVRLMAKNLLKIDIIVVNRFPNEKIETKFSLQEELKSIGWNLSTKNFDETLRICLAKCQMIDLEKEECLERPENCEIVSNQNCSLFTWIDRRDLIFYLIRIINYCLTKKLNFNFLAPKFKIDDVSLGNLIILSQFRLNFDDRNLSNFDFSELFSNSNRREFSPHPNFLRYIFMAEILEHLAALNFKDKDLILRIADINFDNKKNSDAYRLAVKSALENQMDKSLELHPVKVLRDFVVKHEDLLSM